MARRGLQLLCVYVDVWTSTPGVTPNGAFPDLTVVSLKAPSVRGDAKVWQDGSLCVRPT